MLVSCSGRGGAGLNQQKATAGFTSPNTGGGPNLRETPRPVTSGTWPAPAPEAQRRGDAAEAAERQRPKFYGIINGFRFYKTLDENVALPRRHCPVGTTKQADPAAPFPYAISYLPPGTSENYDPYMLVCPDGVIFRAGKFYSGGDALFGVNYYGGEAAIEGHYSRERIETATIQGQPGIIVNAVTPEGYGNSLVAFQTAQGFIEVSGLHIPVEELAKIAGGVTCGSC